MLIAEHSMCQPGRPSPHGDGQDGSPSFFACQRTKSSGSRFSRVGREVAALVRQLQLGNVVEAGQSFPKAG